MTSRLCCRILIAFACLVVVSTTQAQQGLEPGDGLQGDGLQLEASADSDLRVALPATRRQVSTVVALSAAGALRLRLLDAHDEVLAEALGGWIEGNTRLVVPAGEQALALELRLERGAGLVSLRVLPGDVPVPEGLSLFAEQSRLNDLRTEQSLASGDTLAAWVAALNAGNGWYLCQEFGRAVVSLERCQALPTPAPYVAQAAAVPILLGTSLLALGRSEAAHAPLLDGLAQSRAAARPDLELVALTSLADLALGRTDLPAAREHLAAAAALCEGSGAEANRLQVVVRQALVEVDDGDHVLARRLLVDAHRDAVALDDPRLLADVSVSLAKVLRRRGEFAAALDLLTPLAAAELPDRQRINVLGELGITRREAGDPEGARRALSRCLELSAAETDPVQRLRVLLAMAEALSTLREDDQVERLLDEAAVLVESLDSERLRLTYLKNRAVQLTRRALRDGERVGAGGTGWETTRSEPAEERAASLDERAEATLEQALELARALSDHDAEGRLASLLATWHFGRGRLAEALPWAELQLSLARRAGDLPSEAVALCNRSEILAGLGRADDAWSTVAEAEALCRRGAEWSGLVHLLLLRGQLALDAGELPSAALALDEASQHLDAPGLLRLDPDEASRVRSQHSQSRWSRLSQDLVAARVAREPDARAAWVREGFLTLSASQGRGLMEGLESRRAWTPGAAASARHGRRERARLLADRHGLERHLARLRLAAAPAAELAVREAQLAAVTRELAAVETALWTAEPTARVAQQPLGLTPEELAATVLAPGTLLIQFVAGSERLFAYTVLDGALELHDLGDADALNRDVQRYVAGISRPQALVDVATLAREGLTLYDRLLAPLLPDGAGDLLMVPTPELATLPFEALVVAQLRPPTRVADLRFVLQERAVSYGPSVSVLGLLAQDRRAEDSAPWRRLLVLADPEYAETDGLAALPGTRAEALALESTVAGLGVDGPRLEQRLGRQARREVLRGDLAQVDLLHLAAHGLVEADPRLSGLLLSSAEGRADQLALAEVMELDLHAELVVLSACNTARGAVRGGEGVQSLARAFLHAGARQVVASLWQVSDASTARLMERFYSGALERGLTPARALRQAQLALLAEGSPPALAVAGEAARAAEAQDEILRGRPLVDRSHRAPLAGHPYRWAAFIHCGLPR